MDKHSERIVLANATEKDQETSFYKILRPQKLQDYIGQGKAKKHLKIFIEAARQRQEPIDHCLLAGPPGLGKTTLASIIAHEMSAQLHIVTGPHLDKKGDLAAILTNLAEHDILFVDEIHRIPKMLEEVLYSAMEDFKIDLVIGQGPAARTLSMDLPRFTLIGATTKTGLLSGPLRDRFGVHLHLDFYPPDELKMIIRRSAKILGLHLEDAAAEELAKRSRGTPRIANRLLKRIRDFTQVTHLSDMITQQTTKAGLELFEIDAQGLDYLDRKLIFAIIEKFDGGPVGIETLAAAIAEESHTIEDVYEPYLIQQGFIKRTPRGRVATPLAYQHLNLFKNL